MAANGGKFAGLGERLLTFEFHDGGRGNMRFRLTNIAKTLSSVSSARDAGDRVVSDNDGVARGAKKRWEAYPAVKAGWCVCHGRVGWG